MVQDRMLPKAQVDKIFDEEFGPQVEAVGFDPARGDRSWVRSTKAPIIEEIGIGALKGYAFYAGWAVLLDFVPRVSGSGNVRSGPGVALSVDPLDHPDRLDASRLTVSGFRSARRFRRDVLSMASYATTCASVWFDRVTDVASLLPLYEEAMRAPVARFGFDNYPGQRLALAFIHGHLGDADAATHHLDVYLDHGSHAELTERKLTELRSKLEKRLEAASG